MAHAPAHLGAGLRELKSAELQYYWKGHERATVPMVHPTEYR